MSELERLKGSDRETIAMETIAAIVMLAVVPGLPPRWRRLWLIKSTFPLGKLANWSFVNEAASSLKSR